MPKNHPIRLYHEFSQERVRAVYLDAVDAERQALRRVR